MRSRRFVIAGIIAIVLLILCSMVFSHAIVWAEDEPIGPIDLYIVWLLQGQELTNDGNGTYTYSTTYSGDNIADKFVAYYYTDDINNKTEIGAEYYLIQSNSTDVDEIKNVGEYDICVTGDYLTQLNSAGQYNIMATTVNVTITVKEYNVEWNIDPRLNEVSSNNYTVEYTTEDFIQLITAQNSDKIDVVITKEGYAVDQIVDCGTYVFTASTDDSNYTLLNNQVTLVVTNAVKSIVWEVDGIVCSDDVVDIEYKPSLRNGFVGAYYVINGKRVDLELVVSKNAQDTAFVGEYIAQIKTDNIDPNVSIDATETKTINILPKNIYVVSRNYQIDYNAKLPTLACDIYTSYDIDNKSGNILDNWDDEVLCFDIAYELGKTEIEEQRRNWVYDGANRSKTYNIIVRDKAGQDYSNYNITYVGGVLDIVLEEIEVIFRLDNKSTGQVTKTYIQTQKMDMVDIDIATTAINALATREISADWYNGDSVADFNIRLTTDTIFSKYTIYYIYYLNVENKPSSITDEYVMAKVAYHAKNSKMFPLESHYAMENDAHKDVLHRFDHVHDGWTYNNPNIVIDQKSTNAYNADIVLCPHFSPIKHKIKFVRYTIYADANMDPQEVETSAVTFTITEYDNNIKYTLPSNEIEGLTFLGFYYVTYVKDEDGNIISERHNELEQETFALRDLFVRSAIDDIKILAKYEEYKCNVTLVVGDKTITSVSQDIGSNIDKDYYYNLIDKKFGYIYIMSDVPDTAYGTVLVIRVTELPLLWIVLGTGAVIGVAIWLISSAIRKRKSDIDKYKLDVILHNMVDNNDVDES